MKTIKGRIANCELCGKYDELRPYGINLEWICFECGMKNEEAAKNEFLRIIEHDDVLIENPEDVN